MKPLFKIEETTTKINDTVDIDQQERFKVDQAHEAGGFEEYESAGDFCPVGKKSAYHNMDVGAKVIYLKNAEGYENNLFEFEENIKSLLKGKHPGLLIHVNETIFYYYKNQPYYIKISYEIIDNNTGDTEIEYKEIFFTVTPNNWEFE